MVQIEPGSKEYVAMPVTNFPDLDQATVEMAFVTANTPPAEDDWALGAWDPIGIVTRRVANAYQQVMIGRILVSHTTEGGDVELNKGLYHVWIRITVGSQIIVREASDQLEML